MSEEPNSTENNDTKNPMSVFVKLTVVSLVFTASVMFLFYNFAKFKNVDVGSLGGAFQGTFGVAAAVAGAIVTIQLAKIAIDQAKKSNDIAERQARNDDPDNLKSHELFETLNSLRACMLTILLYKDILQKKIDQTKLETKELENINLSRTETTNIHKAISKPQKNIDEIEEKIKKLEQDQSSLIKADFWENKSSHDADLALANEKSKIQKQIDRLTNDLQSVKNLRDELNRSIAITELAKELKKSKNLFKFYVETWGVELLKMLTIINPYIYKAIEYKSNIQYINGSNDHTWAETQGHNWAQNTYSLQKAIFDLKSDYENDIPASTSIELFKNGLYLIEILEWDEILKIENIIKVLKFQNNSAISKSLKNNLEAVRDNLIQQEEVS